MGLVPTVGGHAREHGEAITVLGAGREDLAALVEAAEGEDLDIDEAQAPAVHAILIGKIHIDRVGPDEGATVVVDDKNPVIAADTELRAERKTRPIRRDRMILRRVTQLGAEGGVVSVDEVVRLSVGVGGGADPAHEEGLAWGRPFCEAEGD